MGEECSVHNPSLCDSDDSSQCHGGTFRTVQFFEDTGAEYRENNILDCCHPLRKCASVLCCTLSKEKTAQKRRINRTGYRRLRSDAKQENRNSRTEKEPLSPRGDKGSFLFLTSITRGGISFAFNRERVVLFAAPDRVPYTQP